MITSKPPMKKEIYSNSQRGERFGKQDRMDLEKLCASREFVATPDLCSNENRIIMPCNNFF